MIARQKSPESFLLIMAFTMPLVFSVWMVLLNNFVIEKANFTGIEIGILQSIREIPGFLAFTVVYALLFIKEQRLAIISLLLTSVGVLLTGYFPFEYGLYATTIIMSVGFHYFEAISQSLTLQWINKDKTAHFMGRMLSMKSIASLMAFSLVWLLMEYFAVNYAFTYSVFGFVAILICVGLWFYFPTFSQPHEQNKKLIVRKRYWLFYLLTFFSGARRQIFVVFAGFLMVEKFGFSVANISALFLINYVFNWLFAAKIGKLIGTWGERNILTFEYIGLSLLFISYGFVDNGTVAAVLYVVDHLFFALAIAIKTYFQKIASPEDIAASSGVSFSINHIAAVVIPFLLGYVWISNHSLVFFIGAGFAMCSLVLSQLIPNSPTQGSEIRFNRQLRINKES